MKAGTYFIEVYKNSKGEVKVSCTSWSIETQPYHQLGNKVRGWKTLLITKFRKDESGFKRVKNY